MFISNSKSRRYCQGLKLLFPIGVENGHFVLKERLNLKPTSPQLGICCTEIHLLWATKLCFKVSKMCENPPPPKKILGFTTQIFSYCDAGFFIQVPYNSLSFCKTWLGPHVNITRTPQVSYCPFLSTLKLQVKHGNIVNEDF